MFLQRYLLVYYIKVSLNLYNNRMYDTIFGTLWVDSNLRPPKIQHAQYIDKFFFYVDLKFIYNRTTYNDIVKNLSQDSTPRSPKWKPM